MQFGGTRREHGRPDVGTRLRLVALETPDGRLDFGGGMACVATDAATRPHAAESIARAVIGPRRRDIDGTIEIAGRFVALQSLPAPLLRPSAPAIVDRAMFDEMWRATSAQQRADLEAAHAQRRLDRHRTDAAIERARDRANALAARATSTPPAPVALALAEAFDELAASGPGPVPPSDVDLVSAGRSVEDARAALSRVAGGILPHARTRIETCHRAVVETERLLFEAGKKERPGALAQYQAALGDERAALNEAGIDSYASFLVTTAAGVAPVDLEARLRAELDLAQAEATLEQARHAASGTDARLHEARLREERELDLRARAAQLLGRFPGADPAAELRALRVEHPDAEPTRDALRKVLAQAGETPGDDVVAQARAFVQRRTDDLAKEQRALDVELQALLAERAAHEHALAEFEARLEVMDHLRSLSMPQLGAETVVALVDVMLDRYRNAELLAGRLPLVLDGPFDALDSSVVAVVAQQLAAATDVQTILVSGEPSVVSAFANVGARTVVWPVASHVPGENDLWCVGCAEALRSRNLKVLRRRGA